MEIREKIKNSKTKIVILILIGLLLITFAGFAYAKYITRLNGKATVNIAKWSFKVNGKTNENFVIDLATTRTGVKQEAEVKEGYIGPGSVGVFEIELDATGSEVSLQYDINLNVDYSDNQIFPKNLIFYSDSLMQNAIYHNDDKINLNGFISWNDNIKIHTKTIYWKWDYETGSTQTEKDNNDIVDSYWMGKPITLSMNVIAKQVNENSTIRQHSVTFDANGGTLQGYGNAGSATKQITYGESYGNLPTPIREGYKFIGWTTDNRVSEVENLISGIRNYGGNLTKIDSNNWYIDYTKEIEDTFITFKTATGNELVQGENYTLLFNVSGLTENSDITFAFPRYNLNITKLKNGVNKIKFDKWSLRESNAYDFDDEKKDKTQQFYLSDFVLYKNYGDDYSEEELRNLSPNGDMFFYALWKKNN